MIQDLITQSSSDSLELHYVLLTELADRFLEGNPKLHDIGKITESTDRHGFRDPMAIDKTLNDGEGGIVEGNGRLEMLLQIYESGHPTPRGVKVTESGEWAVPVLFGVNAATESDAIAYAIDHNNTGMFGGDFTALDMSRLYDPKAYTEILEKLAEAEALPTAVDGDDLDLLLEQLGANSGFLNVGTGMSSSALDDDDDAGDDIPDSPVRMVQLFLNKDNHPNFMGWINDLNDVYGTTTLTDCVLRAVEDAWKASEVNSD
ncbi:MAG: hypothetical protein F6J87_06020 [Spirulina sp. SIO3F2]|nr:hypothetical protein [Spirulina sp. SIO3F2]